MRFPTTLAMKSIQLDGYPAWHHPGALRDHKVYIAGDGAG
ncbi:hypothetical protein SAMN04488571_101292 [Methanoculleus thermophilus]|uniref:Uncharacterized protein n=1 Tax=Methanoculleus thermophilus TaxID=2200 RepID=A0A1G8X7C1_9EURY|nr:hypothetical protein SAMN04488571_101292 [Methanoculleus thermophilus]